MALGTNINMMPDMNAARAASMGARNGNLENNLMNGLGLPQREQQYYDRNDRERDLNMCRSGSAPPTIEGSYNAIGSLFRNMDFANGGMSEDEMRSHPAYLSYYYSHDNINPRLPPPLLSKEEWRMHQRLRSGGLPLGVAPNWRKRGFVEGEGSSSLFSVQPGLPMHKEENRNVVPAAVNSSNPSCQPSLWFENKDTELVRSGGAGLGRLGIRRKSFADILQEGYDQSTSLPGPIPRHTSRNLSYDFSSSRNCSFQLSELCSGLEAKEGHNSQVALGLGGVHKHNSLAPSSFGTAVGSSLSRSSTPEVQILPSKERFFPGKMNKVAGSYASVGQSSSMNNLIESAACLSLAGLNNSQNGLGDNTGLVKSQLQQGFVNNPNFQANMTGVLRQHPIGDSTAQKLVSPSNYPSLATSKANVARIRGFDEQNSYNNMRAPVVPNHTSGGCSINNRLNIGADNHLASANVDGQFSGRFGKDMQLDNHFRVTDSADFQHPGHPASQNHVLGGQYISSPHNELLGSHRAHLNALISGQKQSYDPPLLPKGHGVNDGYYEGLAYLLGMQYGGTSMADNLSAIQFGNSMLQNESFPNTSSAMRNSIGGSIGPWKGDIPTTVKGRVAMTLLEEFKNNKTRHFELPDIIGHVVEFSMDQCGSRFIQQKLEIATNEEKIKIFPEITPHARALMTDVFGNYVIQKFFEHGTESQRKALASQVKTHVLPLSLQMYGCRVIQKALEVLDVDEKTNVVAELDGSVLKCVRDQNGNHVIQKCIECVPEDRIHFIISSFFGQVVPLSTHPYGCRVIQRILEHCSNADTQKLIMAEIMLSICTLARDQYGNYVIQHVIQHGNPEERSVIITKLAGQIVKMSQQKFASNVIEKCLTYGNPEERQLIVKEMLGSTDENEPLQAMMKDPFGNYVVQKVLETCDEQTRELILSRIKLHLNALKKYTYVKHVVARVEKLLINAGETCTSPA